MKENEQLDYLIHALSPSAMLPAATEDKWRLFRALVNVREPAPIDRDFPVVQDALLQSLLTKKDVVDADTLQPLRENICLRRGDITTLRADAIVNAANSGLLGCFVPCHSCIDNAIHTWAGVQLRLECAEIMARQGHPEPTGRAKITGAYNLPGRYVLHTVGPIVDGAVHDEDRLLLAGCYRSCLELAEQRKVESIAFCCISTGEYRFPNEEAAKIATETVVAYMNAGTRLRKVVFDVFTERDERIYRELLG